MNFDWQLILTHGLGFLITLWILKKFAWGPLLGIMEERRTKIEGEFKSIEDQKQQVAKLTADYESKLREIESERRAKVAEAVNEGKRLAEAVKSTARQEANEITAKAKAELEREVAKAKVELKNEMVAITIGATEKIIRERLDDQKHRELIAQMIDGVQKA